MQRNNLLFKYVHTVKEKNLPELGSNPNRDWFIDISYAAALWQKF